MIKSKSIKTVLFSLISFLIFIIVFYFVVYINKPVTLVVDGVEISTYTMGNTVGEILHENNIVLQDGGEIYPSKNSKVERGERIVLNNPVPVILYLGNNDPYEIMTTSKDIFGVLEQQGIIIDDDDIVEPSLYTDVIPDQEIFVKYVDIKEVEEKKEIPYETETRYNDLMYSDESKIIQNGKVGLRVIKYQKTYHNGQEVSSNVVYDAVETQPTIKIVEKGTKSRPVYNTSNTHSINVNDAYLSGDKITFLGQEYSIAYTKSVESTAFYNSGSNGNHTTATGNPTVYNPSGWSTIAVDPKVIPLHTKVYIEGYGFGIAHDTGGAIKGNIIDVFMPSREAAYNWGRKKGVKIYILE